MHDFIDQENNVDSYGSELSIGESVNDIQNDTQNDFIFVSKDEHSDNNIVNNCEIQIAGNDNAPLLQMAAPVLPELTVLPDQLGKNRRFQNMERFAGTANSNCCHGVPTEQFQWLTP